MEPATAQTIGELVEGQRQMNGRLDRLEAKVDKLLWAVFVLVGGIIASLVTGIVSLVQ